jgi:hypothetical protein
VHVTDLGWRVRRHTRCRRHRSSSRSRRAALVNRELRPDPSRPAPPSIGRWVDKHPILFVLIVALFLYLTVSLVAISLADQVQRLKMAMPEWTDAWLCGYNGCLTVGANSEGLYVATLSFFPLFHPPLFIPWAKFLLQGRISFLLPEYAFS